MPLYGVWPVSATVIVIVIVKPTVEPGVVVLAVAVLVMARAGVRTVTVVVHWGSVPPAGQL